MKKSISALVGTGIFLVAGAAAAQQYGWSGSYQPTMPPSSSGTVDNIGNEGQLVFGVDRVMGLSIDSLKTSTPAGDVTLKSTTISLFGLPNSAPPSGSAGFTAPSLMFPRLALDYFVVDGVSIGGNLVYAHSSGSIDTPAGSNDTGSTDVFGIAPRVGYAYQFDETFSIWPRAGITYASSTTTTKSATGGPDQETKWHGIDMNLEVLVGISPFEHFAILLGPYVDFPLSGTATVPAGTTTADYDAKLTSFGLTTSVVGYY